jgi:hypothetical protein
LTSEAIQIEQPNEQTESSSGVKKFFVLLGHSLIWVFLAALVFGALAAGVWTLIPTDLLSWGSSKVNLIGYVSHCSYTPYSSLILFVASFIGIMFSMKMKNRYPVGLIVFLGTALGIGAGLINGIDITMYITMGIGLGIGVVAAILVGLFMNSGRGQ